MAYADDPLPGQIAKSKVIFLSLATLKQPRGVDVFIKAAGRDLEGVRKELVSHYPKVDPASARGKPSQRRYSRSYWWLNPFL